MKPSAPMKRRLRVAAGQDVARRKGKRWGGSKPGW